MPQHGDLVAGKYRVLAKLGEGGMGSVFHAQNQLTGKQVALKWIHPEHARQADATERLLREAQAGSLLHHPNVVDVYDVVRDQNTFCMVMELLDGETLRTYLRRNPPPSLREFLTLMMDALEGVAAAHAAGVIHRDLKPDNIFVVRPPHSPRPIAKVVDFGVAKFMVNQGVTLTDTGRPIGTPLYMSFEQLRGDRDLDVRTDVYAFGVMLYEGVTGRVPYVAANLPELAMKVVTSEPKPVRALRPDAPAPLAKLIEAAILRERSQRLPEIRALWRKLDAFMHEYPDLQARVARPLRADSDANAITPTESPEAVPPDTLAAHELGTPGVSRRRLGTPLLVGLSSALIVTTAIVYRATFVSSSEQPASAGQAPAQERVEPQPIRVAPRLQTETRPATKSSFAASPLPSPETATDNPVGTPAGVVPLALKVRPEDSHESATPVAEVGVPFSAARNHAAGSRVTGSTATRSRTRQAQPTERRRPPAASVVLPPAADKSATDILAF